MGIVRESDDLSVFSEELAKAITDWPYLIPFGAWSHKSSTSLSEFIEGFRVGNWLRMRRDHRALGEFGADVALEGSSLRAEIAATRCRDLGGVTVVCDSFDAFETVERFDVVTLIGVLEYARKYFSVEPGNDPVKATLKRRAGCLSLAASFC